MRLARILLIPALAACLAGGLQGCAAYEKCGFRGCPGDSQINSEVQTLFGQHPVLMPPNLIQVQVLDHVVYLTGIVDTDLERKIATDVAAQAPGVTQVVSSIGLSGGR
jgi:osmotically-inducible protein OsmY